MTSKSLRFKRVGAALVKGELIPPPPIRDGEYGLVYAPTLDALMYAPAIEYHGAGAGWTYDGAFHEFSSKTARGSSVSGPWTAVWDTKRKAVVVWAWDYGPGPIGFVVMQGKAPKVLTNGERGDSKFKGDVPIRADDTEWKLPALFGFDAKRGVTVCVNHAGVWELDDLTWTKRTADVNELPKEVRDGYRGGVTTAVYDTKHQRVVFLGTDEDSVAMTSWDGERLQRLDMTGLPDDLVGFSGGYGAGDHPDHGVVVLTAEGELFGLKSAAGGFESLGTAPGAPTKFSRALLAWHPKRKELVLGPQKTRSDSHTFQVFDGKQWKQFGRTVEVSAIEKLSSRYAVSTVNGAYAVSIDGAVAAWDESASKWVALMTSDQAGLPAPMQIADSMWGGELHGATNDGSVFKLERSGATAKWVKVVSKSKEFGAPTWPLFAFDSERQQLVVWGDTKKSGSGRKNDTFLCDGKTWVKAKSSPAAKDEKEHTLVFSPAAKAVVRFSEKEIAVFDGAKWQPSAHKGGKKAIAWRQTACVLEGSDAVLFVKEHLSELEVVRLEKKGSSWAFTTVATFEAPELQVEDDDRNSVFDLGWFNPAKKELVGHFKHDATENFSLSLAGLFD